MSGGVITMPRGRTNLGTDLSDDHPISFPYSDNLVQRNPELVHPTALSGPVKLDSTGQLQCTACHDPHNDDNGKFLVLPHFAGQLCNACHLKNLQASSHGSSPKTWDGIGIDPWPDTEWNSVSANACFNCHTTHLAGGPRLLRYGVEEDNCLVCHNGHVADTDIAQVLEKPFTHPVRDTIGVHDPAEDAVVRRRHVECADCHDPHAEIPGQGSVFAGGVARMRGVSVTGAEVEVITAEHQLCFRCHGSSPGKSLPYTRRLVEENNLLRKFDPSNPSFHPVVEPGRNPFVPSLVPPLTTSSIIKCSDCHNNDDLNGPRGPHGSNFRPLLERQYETRYPNIESLDAYALCYKCHDRSSILSNESFPLHSRHITGQGFGIGRGLGSGSPGMGRQNTPCNVCHDPHGVPRFPPHSGERLINFDLDVVEPNSLGALYFASDGGLSGSCSLLCHGKNHVDCRYDAAIAPGSGPGGGCGEGPSGPGSVENLRRR
jgi:predicted CXXCH cytochrome family protein